MNLKGELVFLVAYHHHTAGRLVNNRCTFRCMTQCIAFIVAFECGLALGRFALVLSLLTVVLLHQDEGDILLSAS